MSDIMELILTKYYGFGGDPNNTKFMTSCVATYNPERFFPKSYSMDESIPETMKEADIGGTSSEIAKDEVENLNPGDSIEKAVRSSRVISNEDILNDEDDEIDEYAALLESTISDGDKFPHEEEENEKCDAKISLTPKKEKTNHFTITRSDSQLMGHSKDAAIQNASDVPSLPIKQKFNRKMSISNVTSILPSQSLQPPRKLPACNGVFLDLTNLSLIEFPGDILKNMPNLRMLYLENNSLTKLPDELFTNLRLLQWLDVRSNKLKSLPKTIARHLHLETILLDGNLFEELPLELCLLPSLKELQTTRNPLTFPPPDIIALGFAVTINFLRIEWNKCHPEEVIESRPKSERKPKPSTILCSDPPILRGSLKSSKIFGSSSTGNLTEGMKKISVRQKGRRYRPSNRCENRGIDEELELRLMWIAKVKEMLTEQSIELQKIKSRCFERLEKRSKKLREKYEQSSKKKRRLTDSLKVWIVLTSADLDLSQKMFTEDIPFAIDIEDGLLQDKLKMPIGKWKNRESTANINEKIMELYESLNRLQKARQSDSLSPRMEQKLLNHEIKKLSDVQEEIQNLRKCNETTTSSFEGSELLPKIQHYDPLPSIII